MDSAPLKGGRLAPIDGVLKGFGGELLLVSRGLWLSLTASLLSDVTVVRLPPCIVRVPHKHRDSGLSKSAGSLLPENL